MQCVILAGGLGTRMRPHTEKAPKTLLPVGDVPFAHYQLGWLARHGVTEVVYCIGHLGEQVRDFVGDGSRWGLAADYVADGPELAGTAGALRRAYDAGVLRDWFLVLYGDSFLPFDFRRLAHAFLEQTRPALMTVYRNQGRWEAGNVRFSDGVVRLYQKARKGEQPLSGMDYIDYGVSAFCRGVIAESVGRGEKKDLSDVCHRLSVEGQLAGLEVAERFYEIGSPAGMRDFEAWTVQHPGGRVGKPLILLDRDGVLNRVVVNAEHGTIDSPLHPSQVELLPGVPEALARLTAAGYGVAVVTNQPAWAKGKTTRANLEATHEAVLAGACRAGGRVLSSHICFHRSEDGCDCRKPKPGLLREALARHANGDGAAAWMAGDGMTDVQAGAALGLRTAFFGPRKCDACKILGERGLNPAWWGPDLAGFTSYLLSNGEEQ